MIVLTTASEEDIFGVAKGYGKPQWTSSFRANAIDRVDGLRFHKGPTSKPFDDGDTDSQHPSNCLRL
jgi:hypothetical protein